MKTEILPSSVIVDRFRHYSSSGESAPQEWLELFVSCGLMYWRDDNHADNTGLGEEILDEWQHDRGTWEPLTCE